MEKSSRYILFFLFFSLQAHFAQSARIRHYKWQVNYQLLSPDCVEKLLITINGQFPGPQIRAHVGDTLVVDVQNLIPTEGIVIHWHGIRQIGTPFFDGTASISQCAIPAGENFTYRFVVDKAGTFFYHGHFGLQRTAGFVGSLIVDLPKNQQEPFQYDGELSIVLNDWWHKSTYEQAIGLVSNPFQWVGEPQSLLIEGKGQYDCSLIPQDTKSITEGNSAICNTTNVQCSLHVMPVLPGKTYRLRIASVASLSSLNFLIEGHRMTVVEADGNYVQPVDVDNLDIYSGETYSVLITTNQDPSRNYWAGVNVRGRLPKTPTGLAILNYLPNPSTNTPQTPPPQSPLWNDTLYSLSQSRLFVARQGYEIPVPPKADRQIVLLNTQNKIDGLLKWSLNNISLSLPATPYLAAMKFNLKNAYDTTPPPANYQPADYDITVPPSNPNATYGSGVYVFPYNSTIDVILQNANALNANVSEIHPWHLHGHDFWVLGYGIGKFDAEKDPQSYNLKNPPLRNTVPVYPYGWTAIRFQADNPGVWAFHCHVEAHLHMGMGVVFAEAIERVGKLPKSILGCGMTKKWLP